MIKEGITVEMLNQNSLGSMAKHIGIEFTEVGQDYVCAKMPVDDRTKQPYGILHGGASVTLAETLGSVGAAFSVDMSKYRVVGLDINSNHIRQATEGYVHGRAEPLHIGRSTHVWQIKITNDAGKLVNVSRLTMSVIAL